jgi:hypothetical protein
VVAAGVGEAGRAGEATADRARQLPAGVNPSPAEDRRRRAQKHQGEQRDQSQLLDAGGPSLRAAFSPSCHAPTLRGGNARVARTKQQLCVAEVTSLLSFGLMEGSPFNLFGDPDEFRARMEELTEQMQSSQRVAWADNAIKLAVEMTVASIGRLELTGNADQQAMQVRDAIRVLFPEAVTLVREAREGLS